MNNFKYNFAGFLESLFCLCYLEVSMSSLVIQEHNDSRSRIFVSLSLIFKFKFCFANLSLENVLIYRCQMPCFLSGLFHGCSLLEHCRSHEESAVIEPLWRKVLHKKAITMRCCLCNYIYMHLIFYQRHVTSTLYCKF